MLENIFSAAWFGEYKVGSCLAAGHLEKYAVTGIEFDVVVHELTWLGGGCLCIRVRLVVAAANHGGVQFVQYKLEVTQRRAAWICVKLVDTGGGDFDRPSAVVVADQIGAIIDAA